jgi:hypothetical protein
MLVPLPNFDPENTVPHAVLGFVLSYARHHTEALAAYKDFQVPIGSTY